MKQVVVACQAIKTVLVMFLSELKAEQTTQPVNIIHFWVTEQDMKIQQEDITFS